MTSDERQALREKHTYLGDYCGFCVKDGGYPADYPCDVIKLLDATENLKPNDLKTEVECDHWVTVKRSNQYGNASSVPFEYWTHNYCPKCGEKL